MSNHAKLAWILVLFSTATAFTGPQPGHAVLAGTAPFACISSASSNVPAIPTATVPLSADSLSQQILASVGEISCTLQPTEVSTAEREKIDNTLTWLPLSFESNRGQSACEVKFLSRAPGYLLQLTATEMRMILRGSTPARSAPLGASTEDAACAGSAVPHAIRFTWLGANPQAETEPESALPGTINYLNGSDSSTWRTSIPTFERVRYREMYPGIDLVYYGNGRQLEYDLIVAPGADPKIIRLKIEGAEAVLTQSGDLDLVVSDGRALQLRAPAIYQQRDGEKLSIDSRYRLARHDGRSEIGFDIAAYDPTLPLVIDPLLYSTFLGGSGSDAGFSIAVNAANEVFVTGDAFNAATDFPTTPGAFDTTPNGASTDAFVTRLNAGGTALVYSTFLGGTGGDSGIDIAVNAANEAFVTGVTHDADTDFPTTAGAIDTTHNGEADVFVTRLNAGGTALLYSTFLGGSGSDIGRGIAVNAANEVFVTGHTFDAATDFQVNGEEFDTTHNGGVDAFVARLNVTDIGLNPLVYSTFLGGSGSDFGYGIAINAANEAFVTGFTYDAAAGFPTTVGAFDTIHNGAEDAFVIRLNAVGTALVYSTLLGGSARDEGRGIAINAANEAFVTGFTYDAVTDFPTTAGAFDTTNDDDAFVTQLNSTGTALIYSTFLGGSGFDAGLSIAVNNANEAFVTGQTVDAAADFPTTPGAFDTLHDGAYDAFVTRLTAGGSALLYSTFLGGSGSDVGNGIAINAANEAFVTGQTEAGFPTTAGAFDTIYNGGLGDVFVTRLATVARPPTITNGPPPNGGVGVVYNFTYTSTGSPTFSMTAGGLPPGLSLSPAGVMTGTPTTAGTFAGTVTASNGTAPDATQDFSITTEATPAPASVLATATTPTSVSITWNGTAGATYEVLRVAAGGLSTTVGSSGSGSLSDTTASPNTAYLYKVRAIAPSASPYSAPDVATTVIFTNPTLVAGTTVVEAAHFTELRTAVNAVRALAGLIAGSYTDATLSPQLTLVRAVHLTDLRSALNGARSTLLLPGINYTRDIILAGTTTISAVDINELRIGVR